MGRSSVLDAHHGFIRKSLADGVGRNELARQLSKKTGETIDPTGLRKYITRNGLGSGDQLWKAVHDTPVHGKTLHYDDCPETIQQAIAEMVLHSDSDSESSLDLDSICGHDYDRDSDFAHELDIELPFSDNSDSSGNNSRTDNGIISDSQSDSSVNESREYSWLECAWHKFNKII